MKLCIRTCMYGLHTRAHARTHIHAHTRTHIHAHTHARTPTYAHTHTHIHARTYTHAHTRTHIHARTYAHTRMHAHTRTYARTHTHAYHQADEPSLPAFKTKLDNWLILRTKQPFPLGTVLHKQSQYCTKRFIVNK